jgi:glutamate/tyrosine decarboxylase-like PLP-dependent enzyme
MDDWEGLLQGTTRIAREWLESLPERRVFPEVTADELRDGFPEDLPDDGVDPTAVVEELARAAGPGLVATPGPRYFGFVIGGSLPASVAADWLTSAWDQNGGLFVSSPASSVIEEVAARWILDVAGLPAGCGVGFATGATIATFTGLAAARCAVLDRAGWDVEADGLVGGPPIRIVVGEEVHATLPYALRLLGLGGATAVRVPVDANGAMRADALAEVLAAGDPAQPTIVAAQAGNVNSGAFDPLEEIADAIDGLANGWLHVDGAFGFWAATSPRLRPLTRGMARADSWTTDAHKWLNVPYDSGITIVAEPEWQARAMALSAAYLIAADRERDPYDRVVESSRRARGFTIYAALRQLGRRGLAELVERNCDLARRLADGVAGRSRIRILNDVVLNQVLVRFDASDPSDVAAGDARTRAVIAAIQRDGTMWAGGTTWHGVAAMRVSVSNWSTTEADIDRSVAAILRSAEALPTA